MNKNQEKLMDEYRAMFNAFGVGSRAWDMLYTTFNSYVFCDENRVSIIGQYLTWYDFTKLLRKNNIVYYLGIDEFLKEYKYAVQSYLKIELE